ncbi:hypothetical protein NDU88_005348 [Pleurodeles waltl]|uniref:Uncharacterized protein n=1 Tax=Pleurodeles waltl TaxID=8319 RepID=A0AAV7RKR0_PLEWA|nr:hypothetical protein NDU88_005348 [Pleurodeles waltl]
MKQGPGGEERISRGEAWLATVRVRPNHAPEEPGPSEEVLWECASSKWKVPALAWRRYPGPIRNTGMWCVGPEDLSPEAEKRQPRMGKPKKRDGTGEETAPREREGPVNPTGTTLDTLLQEIQASREVLELKIDSLSVDLTLLRDDHR